MSTLEKSEKLYDMKRAVFLYMGIAVFCFVFSNIYYIFAHGVRSPYMTYLACIPAVFGGVPALVLWFGKKLPQPGRITVNLYNSGVAALTVSSLLRGIFEIAGTGSEYQVILMYVGCAFLGLGCLSYVVNCLWRKKE